MVLNLSIGRQLYFKTVCRILLFLRVRSITVFSFNQTILFVLHSFGVISRYLNVIVIEWKCASLVMSRLSDNIAVERLIFSWHSWCGTRTQPQNKWTCRTHEKSYYLFEHYHKVLTIRVNTSLSCSRIYRYFMMLSCNLVLYVHIHLLLLPYILVYKSNFLDVKMGSKNRPRLIFGRTWDIPTESQKNAKIHCNKPSYGVK